MRADLVSVPVLPGLNCEDDSSKPLATRKVNVPLATPIPRPSRDRKFPVFLRHIQEI